MKRPYEVVRLQYEGRPMSEPDIAQLTAALTPVGLAMVGMTDWLQVRLVASVIATYAMNSRDGDPVAAFDRVLEAAQEALLRAVHHERARGGTA